MCKSPLRDLAEERSCVSRALKLIRVTCRDNGDSEPQTTLSYYKDFQCSNADRIISVLGAKSFRGRMYRVNQGFNAWGSVPLRSHSSDVGLKISNFA